MNEARRGAPVLRARSCGRLQSRPQSGEDTRQNAPPRHVSGTPISLQAPERGGRGPARLSEITLFRTWSPLGWIGLRRRCATDISPRICLGFLIRDLAQSGFVGLVEFPLVFSVVIGLGLFIPSHGYAGLCTLGRTTPGSKLSVGRGGHRHDHYCRQCDPHGASPNGGSRLTLPESRLFGMFPGRRFAQPHLRQLAVSASLIGVHQRS